MKKLIFTGFIVSLIGFGGLFLIVKNTDLLRQVPDSEVIVLLVGLMIVVGLIMVYKGIHFSMRKRGVMR